VLEVARVNDDVSVEQYVFPSSRFIVPAIELLIIDRYLDADKDFYTSAERLHRRMENWNMQLNIWQMQPKTIQRWIVDGLDRKDWPMPKVIDDFRKRIQAQLEVLRKK
jgi:hypothetical protein